VRIIVLDEADRLLDATDGLKKARHKEQDSFDDAVELPAENGASGSMHSRTFLSQVDLILSEVPSFATRALFSATVTSHVRALAESILRNPVDVTIAASSSSGGVNRVIRSLGLLTTELRL